MESKFAAGTETPVYLPTEADYNELIHFRRWWVQGPGLVYITVDDIVLLEVWNPDFINGATVSMRILTAAGVVVPIQYSIPIGSLTSGATAATKLIPGVEGYLLSATVTSTAQQTGQMFVRLTIQRGQGSGDNVHPIVLCQGYATQYQYLTWPNGVPAGPMDGRGVMRAVVGNAPLVSAEISDTVPAGREWILRSIATTYTTSAGVASREPTLCIDDGAGHVMARSPVQTSIPASQAVQICWAPGMTLDTSGNIQSVGWVMECRLAPGWRIFTQTVNLTGGDQYAAPVYMVEEFIPAA